VFAPFCMWPSCGKRDRDFKGFFTMLTPSSLSIVSNQTEDVIIGEKGVGRVWCPACAQLGQIASLLVCIYLSILHLINPRQISISMPETLGVEEENSRLR